MQMMVMVLCSSIMFFLISMIMIFLASALSKKTISDREKSSPFECGFDPSSSSRMPFSLQFFLIAIIFLIFDVEIVLLLPMVLTMIFSHMYAWTITGMFFSIILLGGVYYEWNQGMLSWSL